MILYKIWSQPLQLNQCDNLRKYFKSIPSSCPPTRGLLLPESDISAYCHSVDARIPRLFSFLEMGEEHLSSEDLVSWKIFIYQFPRISETTVPPKGPCEGFMATWECAVGKPRYQTDALDFRGINMLQYASISATSLWNLRDGHSWRTDVNVRSVV